MNVNISDRQLRFCTEYLKEFNGKQSYDVAYIKNGKKPKGAAQAACRLLKNVNIRKYLTEKIKKYTDETDVTVKRMLAHFAKIAFSPASDYIEKFDPVKNLVQLKNLEDFDSSFVEGIEVEQNLYGSTIKLKMVSKKFALKMLANYTGKFSERIDHTTDGKPIAPALLVETASDADTKHVKNVVDRYGALKNEDD